MSVKRREEANQDLPTKKANTVQTKKCTAVQRADYASVQRQDNDTLAAKVCGSSVCVLSNGWGLASRVSFKAWHSFSHAPINPMLTLHHSQRKSERI
jgi:hypothetical protein